MIMSTKYSLVDFNRITSNGFDFILDNDTIEIISKLALEVGSPDYVKTPVFMKKDKQHNVVEGFTQNIKPSGKKKRGNKALEIVNDDDWNNIKTAQLTKTVIKDGIDLNIDSIRVLLNKLTDKNYDDNSSKIIEEIDKIESSKNDDMMRVGTIIFEIASANRFYSKMYADLYTTLIKKYETMKMVFEKSFNEFMELFNVIEYVDPNVNYDKFCKINKDNEKRKALSSFFINLTHNNIIPRESIVAITRNLLSQVFNYINIENKKNEVDEMTENIAILYDKEIFETDNYEYELIHNNRIYDIIYILAHSKAKDYKSLTNKTIFKFMDMIEM
jgi:hypothetical protein